MSPQKKDREVEDTSEGHRPAGGGALCWWEVKHFLFSASDGSAGFSFLSLHLGFAFLNILNTWYLQTHVSGDLSDTVHIKTIKHLILHIWQTAEKASDSNQKGILSLFCILCQRPGGSSIKGKSLKRGWLWSERRDRPHKGSFVQIQ